jgi:hypothetical protein
VLDEGTIADAEGRGETLEDRQRAALALADAEMSHPSGIPDELVDRLHAHFDHHELLELTLDVMKWNYQKVPVALGVDDEVSPGRLTDLAFDADGNALVPRPDSSEFEPR